MSFLLSPVGIWTRANMPDMTDLSMGRLIFTIKERLFASPLGTIVQTVPSKGPVFKAGTDTNAFCPGSTNSIYVSGSTISTQKPRVVSKVNRGVPGVARSPLSTCFPAIIPSCGAVITASFLVIRIASKVASACLTRSAAAATRASPFARSASALRYRTATSSNACKLTISFFLSFEYLL